MYSFCLFTRNLQHNFMPCYMQVKQNLLGTTLMVATSSRTFGGPRGFTIFSTHLSWTSCRPSVCVSCKCNVFVCPHTPRLSGLLSGSEWKKAAKASVNAPLLSHMTIVFDHNFKKENSEACVLNMFSYKNYKYRT